MLPIVEKLLSEIERLSGRPVLVHEDPTMAQVAAISYARQGAPAHILRYKPQGDPTYQLAVQAGYALRFFSVPEGQRRDFTLPPERRGEFIRRLQIFPAFPPKVQDMLVDGLLLQLRSIPVGIRVDQWLRSSYPDLVAGQNDSVRRQLQENAGALAPHIRESMPKKVVKSSACMNAAFALYWSRLLGEPHQWIPYQALGYESDAEALLSLMDVVPHGPENDCTLIDQWAQKLALNGCYEWARYHA